MLCGLGLWFVVWFGLGLPAVRLVVVFELLWFCGVGFSVYLVGFIVVFC